MPWRPSNDVMRGETLNFITITGKKRTYCEVLWGIYFYLQRDRTAKCAGCQSKNLANFGTQTPAMTTATLIIIGKL
jgi:hypothetical protein